MKDFKPETSWVSEMPYIKNGKIFIDIKLRKFSPEDKKTKFVASNPLVYYKTIIEQDGFVYSGIIYKQHTIITTTL